VPVEGVQYPVNLVLGGRRVLVVDDVVNTGLSVRETAGAAEGVPVNTRYARGADFLAQQAGG